jgi:hypothetical protein
MSIAAKIAMIAMTTRSSINVKAAGLWEARRPKRDMFLFTTTALLSEFRARHNSGSVGTTRYLDKTPPEAFCFKESVRPRSRALRRLAARRVELELSLPPVSVTARVAAMNWQQVCEDRTLADLPYKIELNRQGQSQRSRLCPGFPTSIG